MRQSTRAGSFHHHDDDILHERQDRGAKETLVVFPLPLPLVEKALCVLVGPQGQFEIAQHTRILCLLDYLWDRGCGLL